MTFRELRRELEKESPKPIRWMNSGIVELAYLEPNGAVSISNVVSGKQYFLPRRITELNVEFIKEDALIPLGSLIPKSMRGVK
jgi:hypothetical protein